MNGPGAAVDGCAARVIDACIAVHRVLGPGFLESVYERALCVELRHRDIEFERQVPVAVSYRRVPVGEHRLDLLVARCLVVELKAIETLTLVHKIQVRSYLKATGHRLGLLINFNVARLHQGVQRIIWTPEF